MNAMEKTLMPDEPLALMTQRYEDMRAMRSMQQYHTQELELMIGSGMYAWLQAWARYGSAGAQAHPQIALCDTTASREPMSIGGAAQNEAVGILTAMVWDIVKEDVHVYVN